MKKIIRNYASMNVEYIENAYNNNNNNTTTEYIPIK